MKDENDYEDWLTKDEEEVDEEIDEEEFEEMVNEFSELVSSGADPSDAIVSDNMIQLKGHDTKVQYNGRVYSATIPKTIIQELNLAKGDKMNWKPKDSDNDEARIEIIVEKKGYRLPMKSRKGGR